MCRARICSDSKLDSNPFKYLQTCKNHILFFNLQLKKLQIICLETLQCVEPISAIKLHRFSIQIEVIFKLN
jgi:hypothetical protein